MKNGIIIRLLHNLTNFMQGSMTGLSENPNLPANEFIEKQTGVFRGRMMVYGLKPDEAQALQEFAVDNGLGELQIVDPPLSEDERRMLMGKGKDIPEGSVEVLLGETANAHMGLYQMLGIEN